MDNAALYLIAGIAAVYFISRSQQPSTIVVEAPAPTKRTTGEQVGGIVEKVVRAFWPSPSA